jgi:hypothetical protein
VNDCQSCPVFGQIISPSPKQLTQRVTLGSVTTHTHRVPSNTTFNALVDRAWSLELFLDATFTVADAPMHALMKTDQILPWTADRASSHEPVV